MKLFQKKEICDKCEVTPSKSNTKSKITCDENTSVPSLLVQINDKLSVVHAMKEKIEELKDVVEFYSKKCEEWEEYRKESMEKLNKIDNKLTDLTQKNIYLK